jgi:lysophospholipase L1-like esterase
VHSERPQDRHPPRQTTITRAMSSNIRSDAVKNDNTILCYGDSNTWGYSPATQDRYARDERWTGVLRQKLGDGYVVIEEGLNGRTTVWDDPIEDYRNGKEYLIPCLRSHKPIDLVVIMLGTNDLKARFPVPAFDIAAGAGALVDIVAKSETGPANGAPKVLLVAPPPIKELSGFAEMFEGGAETSTMLSRHFRLVAEERGCALLDAAKVIVSSDLDGIHLDLAEHRKLGMAIAGRVRQMIESPTL